MNRAIIRVACFTVFFFALYIAAGPHRRPEAVAGAATIVNLGRSCLNVNDFGADPGGVVDSTPAFQAAFESASQVNGVAVCAPAGTYKISSDILLYSNSRSGSGGVSFYGAGASLTVLDDQNTNGNYVFDSCPDYSNVTPSMPTPNPLCPSAPVYGGSATPYPGAGLSGVTFADFTIKADPPGGGPPGGLPGASGFYFPRVNGMLFDNVCVTGSPTNVYDFGEYIPNAFSGIVIRDSTCESDFYGHYIALHGGGSGLLVERNGVRGNQTYPQFGSGVLFDTSDVIGQVISQISFRSNDFEGVYLGNFDFLPAPSVAGPASSLTGAQWIGNIYDHCAFACYYFGADSPESSAPTFSDIRVSDRWAISDYDSIFADGGAYRAVGSGVQGLKIAGPALYGSDNSRSIYPTPNPAGGTPVPAHNGGSFFMVAVPQGQTVPANAGVAIEFSGGNVEYLVAPSSASVTTLVHALAVQLSLSLLDVARADSPTLANPSYGLVSMNPSPPGIAEGSGPNYYTVVTTGNLRPVGAQTTCPLPAGLITGGFTTPGPCATGEFDIGDAVSLRNGSHDVDIVGIRAQSPLGVSVHVWPGGADNFHILDNVLGENHGSTSYTALQLDYQAAPSPNPTSYHIEGNDLVGATPIVAPLSTPSFLSNGLPPVMRNNRGSLGVIVGPNMSTGITVLTIRNAGPLDCTYYFSAWSAAFSASTIAMPGLSAVALPTSKPVSAFVPVGAVFQATAPAPSSVTYTGFCQP